MLGKTRAQAGLSVMVGGFLLAGCASTERAVVRYSFVVAPERTLPPGMKTISVQRAKLGPATDPKWSELSTSLLQSLVNESRTQFGTEVNIADRRDTDVVFDEADLKAAGMSTEKGSSSGQLLAAQGAILSNIDVKVEKHSGKERTISGINLDYFTGQHGTRGGGGAIETDEVETVTRNMTVQANFRLIDTANGKVWDQHSCNHQATEGTHVSPFFGSSKTEAALTPEDRIIGTLVERGAREFLSKLMPVRIDVEAEVDAGGNKSAAEGVRFLRADEHEQAIAMFQAALRDNGNDHRAAFGAGVASEASGRYTEALRFYQQACAAKLDPTYMEARDRMKAYSSRARK